VTPEIYQLFTEEEIAQRRDGMHHYTEEELAEMYDPEAYPPDSDDPDPGNYWPYNHQEFAWDL